MSYFTKEKIVPMKKKKSLWFCMMELRWCWIDDNEGWVEVL
jgi:hypothetical protein